MYEMEEDKRPVKQAILRGFRKRCPNCGQGRIFRSFLKPTDGCSNCGEALSHIRTDDFAPWLTIVIVGHIIVPLILHVERNYPLPLDVQFYLWTPLVIFLVLVIRTIRSGNRAPAEVWEKPQGLEWTVPSPAPYHTFAEPPEVK